MRARHRGQQLDRRVALGNQTAVVVTHALGAGPHEARTERVRRLQGARGCEAHDGLRRAPVVPRAKPMVR